MARRTIMVCDMCGGGIEEAEGAVLRLTYADARRGVRQADVCDDCSKTVPGEAVARRGRRPKQTEEEA